MLYSCIRGNTYNAPRISGVFNTNTRINLAWNTRSNLPMASTQIISNAHFYAACSISRIGVLMGGSLLLTGTLLYWKVKKLSLKPIHVYNNSK
jgi:hypothetical protein